jgi:hypothetical protein
MQDLSRPGIIVQVRILSSINRDPATFRIIFPDKKRTYRSGRRMTRKARRHPASETSTSSCVRATHQHVILPLSDTPSTSSCVRAKRGMHDLSHPGIIVQVRILSSINRDPATLRMIFPDKKRTYRSGRRMTRRRGVTLPLSDTPARHPASERSEECRISLARE